MQDGSIKKLFADVVNDENLSITVQQQVPSDPYVGPYKGQLVHFRAAALSIPVAGTVVEGLALSERASKTTLSYCKVLPKGLFLHLPEDTEIFTHNAKFFPASKVTTANGQSYYVTETPQEIAVKISESREQRAEIAAQVLAKQLMKNMLG